VSTLSSFNITPANGAGPNFVLSSLPARIQEGATGGVKLVLNVTNAANPSVYNFIWAVTDPAGVSRTSTNSTASTTSSWSVFTNYPAAFSGSTNLVGVYRINVTETVHSAGASVAIGQFQVGLTDSASYQRTAPVVIRASGYVPFDNVTINGSYTVTPSRANFSFNPVSRSFVHAGSHTDASFTATFTAAGLNPLDTSEYFVRQHYIDFLSREPDESGFNFWVNQIESCGGGASCREVRRINVSAAFFLSIEFQQTGYLVYRTYKTAYGNISGTPVPLRFSEFLPDTRQIGQGVVVGQTGWEATLENNKRVFMEAFVRRSRFTTAFPPGTSAGSYVDTINANAGGLLNTAERNQLVNDLISGAKTGGQVLRVVAEDQDLINSEFNRAFVLMEYFGYLRRNPNDPPEQTLDFQGYNFWLGKLNSFGGNFQNAEMVKAFIVSSEYRGRFPR